MKQSASVSLRHTKCFAAVAAALGMAFVSVGAWGANDLATTEKAGFDTAAADVHNTKWLGHNDLQGRTVYQTTVHTYPNGRVYAFAGHFNGKMLNPMTGVVETNGTSIVDVTDPRKPVYVKHLPADNGGARMNMICDGSVLPNGAANGESGRVYLLRENGSLSHEVWDVTNPAQPTLKSVPVTGQDVTHRSWWDCNSGIAYIVAGATGAKAANPDHWNHASSPSQHLKIFDLSNPANPVYIEDYGFPGQNPGSTFKIPGSDTVPPGVHGPIAVSTFKGKTVNRLYMPYGVESNGIIQIVDTDKLLPPPYGHGTPFVNPQSPTDAELLAPQIGVIYMPGAEGGHSSMPYFGMKLDQYQNFTENNVRDILAVSSEETDNRCTGSPHLLYLMDITSTKPDDAATTAEQHPWPISTVTVNDFSGRPNFCSRGTRFGVHSMNENFNDPFYGKLMISAWFDAGIRVTDIRDPYHPVEVAYFIPPINANTQASQATIDGTTYTSKDVSCDNTYVDNDGLLYCGDRVGGGLDIVQLTGQAAQIGGVTGTPRNN
jgi:hypothetical protein